MEGVPTDVTGELDYAKKLIALDYYTRLHVSIGYCAQIAQMSEEDYAFLRQLMDPIFQMSYHNLKEEEIQDISMSLARIGLTKSRAMTIRRGASASTMAMRPTPARPSLRQA